MKNLSKQYFLVKITNVNRRKNIHICAYLHTYTHICVYMYVCMCICLCIHIYDYANICNMQMIENAVLKETP